MKQGMEEKGAGDGRKRQGPARQLHHYPDFVNAVPAFNDLLVIDLSRRLSGAFAARLFADHGADVIMLEPPDGHPLRSEAPFLHDLPGPDRSALHAFANWSKRSLLIHDPEQAADWLACADVVVTTDRPSDLERWPLRTMRDDAVHLSLTAYGLDSPLAESEAGNLTINARCGWSYINALRDEPPLALPSRQSGFVGGLAGFVAAAAALRRRDQSGDAELVDVREFEALLHTGYPWTIQAVYLDRGTSRGAAGGRGRHEPGPLYDARDGRMNFGFGDWHNWQQAMDLFNLPDQGARPELQQHGSRYAQDMSDVQAGVARELASMDKWPLFHQLAKLRCISGVVQTVPELAEHEQLESRQFIVHTTLDGETVRASGNPHPMDPPSWAMHSPAPTLGSAAGSAATSETPAPKPRVQTSPTSPITQITQTGPLDGVRVLTFTQAWSGTFGTQLLAMLGADVVQIEALQRVDIWRKVSPLIPPAVRDDSRRQHPLNTQGLYNAVNLNKRGVTLDLNSDQGRDLFWRLVPGFDVICENFRPGVLAGWGINLPALAVQRPDIILAHISGYGQTGPYAAYPANGATTEPMSGIASIHGYEGDHSMNTGGLFPDPISGFSMAAAVIAGLHRRDRVGGPQRIDVSMMEAMALLVGDAVIEHDATGRTPAPIGNRHRQYAPHNVYPCLGDDEWAAIAVQSDNGWQALCTELGRLDLSDDPRFSTAAARKANEAELDRIISAWTSSQNAREVERRLVAVGVDASRVYPPYELFSIPDPHLLDSGCFQSIDHPETGPSWLAGPPWRFSGPEDRAMRPSPTVGEHSFEVLSQELGVSRGQYDSLVAAGVTGTIYDLPAPPP